MKRLIAIRQSNEKENRELFVSLKKALDQPPHSKFRSAGPGLAFQLQNTPPLSAIYSCAFIVLK